MQQSHPVLIGDRAYLLAHVFHLITMDYRTGEYEQDHETGKIWQGSKTCATPTASANGLYMRRNSCYMYDLKKKELVDLTRVTRPSCWMSIIPAGGLLVMPEGSSGCSCGFALQMSLTMAPVPPPAE